MDATPIRTTEDEARTDWTPARQALETAGAHEVRPRKNDGPPVEAPAAELGWTRKRGRPCGTQPLSLPLP